MRNTKPTSLSPLIDDNRFKGKFTLAGVRKIKIQFYLSDYHSKKKSERTVFCYLHTERKYNNYKPFKFSTAIKCHPDFWNKDLKRATGTYDALVNPKLDALSQLINEYWGQKSLMHKDDNLVSEIRREWDNILKTAPKEKENTNFEQLKNKLLRDNSEGTDILVFQYKPIKLESTTWTEYISIATKKMQTGIPPAPPERIYKYAAFLTVLRDFHEKNKIPEIPLNKISTEYFEAFLIWVKQTKKISVNYFSRYTVNLKKFYNYAKDIDDLPLPKINFNKPILKKVQEKSKSIALSVDQLKSIISLEFKEDKYIYNSDVYYRKTLEKARSILIIGCLTGGLRISDLKRLDNVKEELVNGQKVKYIESYSLKTKTYVKLPLFAPALHELAKNGWKVPIMADQELNNQLKFIGKLAGLDSPILVQKMNIKTGKTEVESVPMFMMMSSKVCRKTFCTMMLNNYKLPTTTIMAFSGHATLQAFESYISESGYDSMFRDMATMVVNDETFS